MSWRTVATFIVIGDPKPQPRPRAFSRGGHTRVYDPATAEGWKAALAMAAREHIPSTPFTGPVRVWATLRFRRPKGHYRSSKPERGLRMDAPIYHTGKPDRDNLDKAILDCLKTIRMMQDDGQVCGGEVVKLYGETPGAEIRIEVDNRP